MMQDIILRANHKAHGNFTCGKDYEATTCDLTVRDTHYVAVIKKDDLGLRHYMTAEFKDQYFEEVGHK